MSYCHLRFLGEIKSVSGIAGGDGGEDEVRSTAQSESVCVTEKEPSVALADESTVPIGTILGKIFCVDQGIDLVGLIILIDDGVDTKVPL